MKSYYPINLDLKGKKCVVVGGGKVAQRKVESLLACEANVLVASLKLSKRLKRFLEQSRITHFRGDYHPRILKDGILVIAATDKSDINFKIFQDAVRLNKLINVVDSPDRCNFFVPAVLRRGALTISISTSGSCPALARKIKQELKDLYGREYAKFLSLLGNLRPEIKAKYDSCAKRKLVWQRLVNSDILDLLKKNKIGSIKKKVKKCMS